MSNGELNNIKISFNQWFYNTPAMEIKALKERIIADCHLPKDDKGFCFILYSWLKYITPVPPLAQEKINAIAGMELNYEKPKLTIQK